MKLINISLFALLSVLLTGCTGYRVGSTLDPSIQTVSISIVNNTMEPSIEVEVMKALRAELQMDGRLEVKPAEIADAALTVTLKEFDLIPLAYDRKQGARTEEYRMTITAVSVLSDPDTGKVIAENPFVQGDSEFEFVADLTTTKRGALPKAAADLARKIVSTTTTTW